MANSLAPTAADVVCGDERIVLRVARGGIYIEERELRYQLERKDNHPLTRSGELLRGLAEIEARGLLVAELCFRLTAEGQARLAAGDADAGGGCEW